MHVSSPQGLAPAEPSISSVSIAWSPYVVTVWYEMKKDTSAVIYADLLSLAGDLVKRIGPLEVATYSEPVLFAAREDLAVLGAGKELFRFGRSTSKEQGLVVACDRLSTSQLSLAEWKELSLSDLKVFQDRAYAAMRLWREKGEAEERRFCVASWSAKDGAPLWVGEVEVADCVHQEAHGND